MLRRTLPIVYIDVLSYKVTPPLLPFLLYTPGQIMQGHQVPTERCYYTNFVVVVLQNEPERRDKLILYNLSPT